MPLEAREFDLQRPIDRRSGTVMGTDEETALAHCD